MHSTPGSNPAAAAYTFSSSCWCWAHPVRRQSEISIEAQPDSRKAAAAQLRNKGCWRLQQWPSEGTLLGCCWRQSCSYQWKHSCTVGPQWHGGRHSCQQSLWTGAVHDTMAA